MKKHACMMYVRKKINKMCLHKTLQSAKIGNYDKEEGAKDKV